MELILIRFLIGLNGKTNKLILILYKIINIQKIMFINLKNNIFIFLKVGFIIPVGASLITELTPKNVRGKGICMIILSINFG